MCEILMIAVNKTHTDSIEDRVGCYKVGMPVVIMPDGHTWGSKEVPPMFYLIKVPGISVERAAKFVLPQYATEDIVYRRRRWQIRVSDLPAGVISKFQQNGEVIIKAGDYSGAYDYTWTQVRNYFRDLQTGLDGADFD